MAKRHNRDSRIIDADEMLKKSGFKMPSPEVLRHQSELLAEKDCRFKRFTQFGPLASMVKSLKK